MVDVEVVRAAEAKGMGEGAASCLLYVDKEMGRVVRGCVGVGAETGRQEGSVRLTCCTDPAPAPRHTSPTRLSRTLSVVPLVTGCSQVVGGWHEWWLLNSLSRSEVDATSTA